MLQFGPLNTTSHPAGAQPPENLTKATNVDYWHEASISPRDGLSRPSSFPLIAHTGTTLTAGNTKNTFGTPIRSLLVVSTVHRGFPALLSTE